jgi:methyl-accepting chemotaxis protein
MGSVRLFQDTKINVKLGILIGLLAIPIGILLAMEFIDKGGQVDVNHVEVKGVNYIDKGILPLQRALNQHRVYAGNLEGANKQAAEYEKAAAQVDAAIEELKKIDKKDGASWGTAATVEEIVNGWAAVRASQGPANAEKVIAADTAILESVLDLVFQVGFASHIYLEEDAKTKAGILGLSEHSFAMTTQQGLAAANAALALEYRITGRPVDDTLKGSIFKNIENAEESRRELHKWFEVSMGLDKKYEATLRPLLTTAEANMDTLRKLIGTELEGRPVSEDELLAASIAVTEANTALTEGAHALVHHTLNSQASALEDEQWITLGVSSFLFLVALGLAIVVTISITAPMEKLAAAADRMSLGELDVEIDYTSKNEIGQLADSLRRMQVSLRGAIERLRMRRSA